MFFICRYFRFKYCMCYSGNPSLTSPSSDAGSAMLPKPKKAPPPLAPPLFPKPNKAPPPLCLRCDPRRCPRFPPHTVSLLTLHLYLPNGEFVIEVIQRHDQSVNEFLEKLRMGILLQTCTWI